MKKLIHYFKIVGVIAVVMALYSFGNAVVCHYAMIDLERTINIIETTLLGLVAFFFIGLIILFYIEEL